uniref:DUF1995 domain-containing protein n=1 Tax=Chrysotila carterae TaxID=13221 RepID=A0A7S4B0C3_CHRCT
MRLAAGAAVCLNLLMHHHALFTVDQRQHCLLHSRSPSLASTMPYMLLPLRAQAAKRCVQCSMRVPESLDSTLSEGKSSLRAAVLSGYSALNADVRVPALDITSRGYDPPAFARFALELARELLILADGPVLVMLPGMSAGGVARQILNEEEGWSDAERDHIQISSLSLLGAPSESSTLPAAIIFAGLAPASSADDSSVQQVRQWLQLAIGVRRVTSKPPLVLVFNSRLPTPPVEMAAFETAYALLPYVIQPSATSETSSPGQPSRDAEAVLLRAFPDEWHVCFRASRQDAYTKIASRPRKPSMDQLAKMLELVCQQAWTEQAAEEAVRSAADEGVGAEAAGGSDADGHAPSPAPADEQAARAAAERSLRLLSIELSGGGERFEGPAESGDNGDGQTDRAVAKSNSGAGRGTGDWTDGASPQADAAAAPDASAVSPPLPTAVAFSYDALDSKRENKLYTEATLLRMRTVSSARFDDDAHALHLFVLGDADELQGVCLLRSDQPSEGVATMSQLAIQDHLDDLQRSRCAASLLTRAVSGPSDAVLSSGSQTGHEMSYLCMFAPHRLLLDFVLDFSELSFSGL